MIEYVGKYIEDDNTVVIVYNSQSTEVHLRIPNRTKEEALKWLEDEILPTAEIEVSLI